MSRGFAGILAALALSSLLLAAFIAESKSLSALSQSKASALLLERAHYDELSFKDSLASALSHARGTRPEEVEWIAGENLAKWVESQSLQFAQAGTASVFWWGFASESELDEIKRQSLELGSPQSCNCCFSFSEAGEWDYFLARELLEYEPFNKTVKLSKNRVQNATSLECGDGTAIDIAVPALMGATAVYKNGSLATLFLAREGFSAKTASEGDGN